MNGLAHRIAQHKTFSYVDPDCAAITTREEWRLARQWLDVVARTGTSLFLSPGPAAMNPETKEAMRDAMALVCDGAEGYPSKSTDSATPDEWRFTSPASNERRYDWLPEEGVAPELVS